MMPRMLLSSSSLASCILVLLLCLSHQCNGRFLCSFDVHHTMDDNAKVLKHSIKKGLKNDNSFMVQDVDLKIAAQGKDQTNSINKEQLKQKDYGSKNEKDAKFKELEHRHHRLHHDPKSITFRVPPKNKRVHQQPGFALDYSPPKTHPPVHN